MVKFEKFFKSNLIDKWENEYINYAKLINIIIEIENNMKIDSIKTKNKNLNFQSKNRKFILEEDLNNIITNDNTGYLKSFLTLLNDEIKKIYIFFSNSERKLYKMINFHLHKRKSYSNFNFSDILKEIDNLLKISYKTNELCSFISLNMTAIKKILLKFDKKFYKNYGEISRKFLKEATENQSKDLVYILQFKMIDEVSALLEDLLQDLKIVTNKRKQELNNLPKTEKDIEAKVPLVSPELNLLSSIFDKMIDLLNNIINIDESNCKYRASFKSWSIILKEGNKVLYNHNNNNVSITNEPPSILAMDDEPILEKILSNRQNKIKLSKENTINIYITLFHTIFYLTSYLIILPTNSNYLDDININPIYSGLVLGITPFFAVISSLFFTKWSNSSYKEPLIFSIFLFLSGSFFYSSANYFNSLLLICIGRAFIGFGSGRILIRRYMLENIPRNLINKYSMIYTICGTIGLCLGPILAFLLLFINKEYTLFYIFILNENTNAGWLCVILSFIFLILTLFFFTESRTEDFNILVYDSNNNTITSSVSVEEKKMINDIDRKLSEINAKNNYSDTNLVAKNIDFLSFKEKNQYEYIFRCFIIINLILFSLRLANEAMIVGMFHYLLKVHNVSNSISTFILALVLLLTIPIKFYHKEISIRIKERKLLLICVVICSLSSIAVSDVFGSNLIVYIIFFTSMITFTNLLETCATGLISKIIPPDYKVKKFSAGFIFGFGSSLGRILGCCLFTISGSFENVSINMITFILAFLFFMLCFIMIIVFYSDLRVKAIARIIRKCSKGSKSTT